nr:hypothetical protein [Candidatus Sigynarchaeota archaeon]
MSFKNNNPISKGANRFVWIALIFISLGIVVLFFGQIWVAPLLVTLGLGLLLKNTMNGSLNQTDRTSVVSGSSGPSGSPTDRRISFWNLPLSRIMAIIIIATLATIDAMVFRTPIIDRLNPVGNWQILNGPTLFYPLAFLPLVIAVGMGLHLIFSIRKITLTLAGNVVTVRERGVTCPTNHIPLDSVIHAHLRSNTTGLKALWLIPWSIQIWGNLASAWHYFANEFTFGAGLFIGPVYLLHALLYVVVLGLLVFTPEYEYGWETASHECYLRWFSYKFLQKFPLNTLTPFLGNNPMMDGVMRGEGLASRDKKRTNYYLVFGLVSLVVPVISIAIPFFFGDVPRIVIFMGAVASLGVALKDHGPGYPNKNPFGYVNHETGRENPQAVKRPRVHTPLEIMVYISELLQILSIGVILTTKWRIYPVPPAGSGLVTADLIASTVLGIAMVFVYLKQKWDVIEEPNKIARIVGIIVLGTGILLSCIL